MRGARGALRWVVGPWQAKIGVPIVEGGGERKMKLLRGGEDPGEARETVLLLHAVFRGRTPHPELPLCLVMEV